MPTATRGAAGLILLGALLAQAPLAAARIPQEPSGPAELPATAPAASTAPTAEPPVARSWSELARQVIRTAPHAPMLRATTLADQSKQVMRCFKLETENYCLGLGFVDKLPSGAQLSELTAKADSRASADAEGGDASAEQDIATGALTPAGFVTARSALPDSRRLNAELEEMRAAWDGRDKARALRELEVPAGTSDQVAPTPTPTPTTTPTTTPTVTPSVPVKTTPASPGVPKPSTSAPVVQLPSSSYIMKGYQTSQERGYWCGPATFQSIDWADDKQKDTQASWAKDLGSTSSGTAITAMVKQTNLKTNWDLAAGSYIVQSVGHWNTQKFFAVHRSHLGDGKPAPIIEHPQLLKRYFPYLAFNHSGHFQVGRGYDAQKGTIAIFEVFNERRFNSRGNVTHGPKNVPASALFNATLANSFKNMGL
ncbi:C39 family peptidase [Kribbella sp. NPDC023855]|uniref:C39 family peptidase n=1 Tax=Kribbella sp. NPDC023855 TaxID=3154698 RepID=UPI00340F2DB9